MGEAHNQSKADTIVQAIMDSETAEEIGTSQNGLFLTQEQIDAGKVPEKQVPGFPLVGPIGTQWHKEHPEDPDAEPDESLLLGS